VTQQTKRFTFITILIAPFLCFWGWVWLMTVPHEVTITPATLNDPYDCTEVGTVFVNHLLRNDVTQARQVVVPQKWAQLEEWAASRDGFEQCTTTLDNDVDGIFSVTGGSREALTRTFNASYMCAEEAYVFSVDDVVLEQFETGCKVLTWRASEQVGW